MAFICLKMCYNRTTPIKVKWNMLCLTNVEHGKLGKKNEVGEVNRIQLGKIPTGTILFENRVPDGTAKNDGLS